jgi:hypothetical protein
VDSRVTATCAWSLGNLADLIRFPNLFGSVPWGVLRLRPYAWYPVDPVRQACVGVVGPVEQVQEGRCSRPTEWESDVIGTLGTPHSFNRIPMVWSPKISKKLESVRLKPFLALLFIKAVFECRYSTLEFRIDIR